jgi:hypothetical protein
MMRPGFWRSASLGVLLALIFVLAACNANSTAVSMPTPTTQAIRMTLDRTSYTVSQPIGVTIANTSKTDYYATDGRSACTFLQLEFYDATNKKWVATLPCLESRPPAPLLIAAGMSEPFTLPPGNSSSNGNEWGPGLYRIALTYGTQPDATGDVTTAYSAGFRINS